MCKGSRKAANPLFGPTTALHGNTLVMNFANGTGRQALAGMLRWRAKGSFSRPQGHAVVFGAAWRARIVCLGVDSPFCSNHRSFQQPAVSRLLGGGLERRMSLGFGLLGLGGKTGGYWTWAPWLRRKDLVEANPWLSGQLRRERRRASQGSRKQPSKPEGNLPSNKHGSGHGVSSIGSLSAKLPMIGGRVLISWAPEK